MNVRRATNEEVELSLIAEESKGNTKIRQFHTEILERGMPDEYCLVCSRVVFCHLFFINCSINACPLKG